MKDFTLALTLLPQTLAVCRLDTNAPIPSWVEGDRYFSVTRTDDELSVVCTQERVPEGVEAERDWRIFKVEGPLPFHLTGVLASLATPLGEAGISIFAVSTFDTDYFLLKAEKLEEAKKILGSFCRMNP